jgi:hypothetical protein
MPNVAIDVTKNTKPLMPKWQKWLLISLAVTVIISGLMIFLFRNNIFKAIIKPPIPFQVAQEPSLPDYNDASAWVLRPQIIDSSKPAVFFVHPVTYYDGKMGWNADINQPDARQIIDEIVLPNHAAPFMENTQVWLPHYRQATLYSSLSFNEDAKEALNLAYSDVETAFLTFMKHKAPEQKIIIVGMNQGALHILRLLQKQPAELRNNIIAIYMIDQALPVSLLKQESGKSLLGSITPCKSLQETQCFMNFFSVSANNNRKIYLARKYSPVYDKISGYYKRGKIDTFCTNPLNGGSNDIADEKLNSGAVAASKLEEGAEPALLPAATGAICKDGLLLVDSLRPSVLSPPVFELGSFYKVSSYNLFYDNLKTDVQERIKSDKNQAAKKK